MGATQVQGQRRRLGRLQGEDEGDEHDEGSFQSIWRVGNTAPDGF
jgi:hypothetical protein